jgi:ATP-dependent Clp protease ATP-binding subunit ClpA
MANVQRIEYYNLRDELRAGTLPKLVGRKEELERLTRIIGRRTAHNAFVVGPAGIGKTTFVYGWMAQLSAQERFAPYQLLQLDTDHLYALEDSTQETYTADALASLPKTILFIDTFGNALYSNPSLAGRIIRTYTDLLKNPHIRTVLALEQSEYDWLTREYPAFVRLAETLTLKQQPNAEYVRILRNVMPHLNEHHKVLVPTEALSEIVAQIERFPALGQLPRAAISLLDEALSHSSATNQSALREDSIAQVVADKLGIPRAQVKADDMSGLRTLEESLNARIINQTQSIAKIATTIQRAKLGLRNPNKPLGSFLLLGPSGVGKTETAKLVAETLFGRSESFVRFDMSEFQQDHTIQRLIGAPAGYVGYSEGGALTNALRREPHSLILLDEIEKAHSHVFDIFLQVLDDGRLTSGQNETVDARNAIFMATSNIGVDDILAGYAAGEQVWDEVFIRERIVPALARTFRLEFINRFDSILIFNPLSVPSLIKIAELEVAKIEQRLSKHKVKFSLDPAVIEEKIKSLADPRFGARPVKRFIEEACESLLAQSLLGTK